MLGTNISDDMDKATVEIKNQIWLSLNVLAMCYPGKTFVFKGGHVHVLGSTTEKPIPKGDNDHA